MKFINDTGLPARLFRSEYRQDELLAIAVVKATHRLHEDGGLAPAEAHGPEPADEATDTELGIVPGDRVPFKRGTDVWIMGTAHTPLGVPEAAMVVALGVGDERRELLVIGDRTWDSGLVATRPAPFDRMPVVYTRAYGGSAPTERGAVPHADNPAGRGFALDASAARGMALPNVEWPDQRIRSWRDQPQTAGFAAISEFSGLHFARALDTESLALTRPNFKPGLFNAAHPRLVFPELAPHTTIWLSGFRPDRRLSFRLPAVDLDTIIRLGSREHRLAMRLDTIGIAADEGIVQLTYRASARYRFVAGQQRAITLAHGERRPSCSAPSL